MWALVSQEQFRDRWPNWRCRTQGLLQTIWKLLSMALKTFQLMSLLLMTCGLKLGVLDAMHWTYVMSIFCQTWFRCTESMRCQYFRSIPMFDDKQMLIMKVILSSITLFDVTLLWTSIATKSCKTTCRRSDLCLPGHCWNCSQNSCCTVGDLVVLVHCRCRRHRCRCDDSCQFCRCCLLKIDDQKTCCGWCWISASLSSSSAPVGPPLVAFFCNMRLLLLAATRIISEDDVKTMSKTKQALLSIWLTKIMLTILGTADGLKLVS